MVAQPPVIADGWLYFPGRPGLGVELAPEVEHAYPYLEGHYAISVER